jgi:hypothetical protein
MMATTTRIVAITGSSTPNAKMIPMLSVQPWLRAMIGTDPMKWDNTCLRSMLARRQGWRTDLRRTMLVTTVLVLMLATGARAQDTTISAALTPNTPAAASTFGLAINGAAPELAGAVPESLAVGLQRGFALDLGAVAGRCDASHVTTGDCPAESRVGSGSAVVHASGFINKDIPATIDIFLADPAQAGDLASVVLRVTALGQSRTVRARLLALPAGVPFGYELLAAGFAAAVPTFPGVALALSTLNLQLGASRTVTKTVVKHVKVKRKGKRVTVKRKVKRKVRHDLIHNPATCAGSWAARVTVRVAGVDHARDLAVPCTPA